jgi:hypothetical protein
MANSFLLSGIITAIPKVITQHVSKQKHSGTDDMVRVSQKGRTFCSTAVSMFVINLSRKKTVTNIGITNPTNYFQSKTPLFPAIYRTAVNKSIQ